ncbi:GLYL3 protein, partial [Asarcornis scutulata]|nr:GLYL3 protein [Asarcornis scutulata]
MLILRCPARLQRLEDALRRSLPRALPVYGAVLNINRGNPGDFEVAVDAWPDFGAVLARRSGEVAAGRFGVRGCGCAGGLSAALPHRHQWTTPTGTCRPPSTGMLDPDVRLGTLSRAHVELLDSTWAYGGNAWSRHYLGELLERFPSLCLLSRAGQPLCWALTDGFAAGAHGFTLPSQRRRGLMRVLTALAARRALARGFPAYG